MKLLSILVAGLLSCSVLCTFNPMTAKAEGKLSKETIVKYLTRINNPFMVDKLEHFNLNRRVPDTYRVILLNRLEENIGVDENGKVVSFILMESESSAYGGLSFTRNNDLLVKVHPDGHFTAFRTMRTGSRSPMDQTHTWNALGDEITFENLKQHPKWLKNRFKVFPKALKEAQDAVNFRKELHEMLK